MPLAICGLVCQECRFFEKNCPGCGKIRGKPFWAVQIHPDQTCPIFTCCVKTKKKTNCGTCSELPCKTFSDLKDPGIPEEQHLSSIQERVRRLKNQAAKPRPQ